MKAVRPLSAISLSALMAVACGQDAPAPSPGLVAGWRVCVAEKVEDDLALTNQQLNHDLRKVPSSAGFEAFARLKYAQERLGAYAALDSALNYADSSADSIRYTALAHALADSASARNQAWTFSDLSAFYETHFFSIAVGHVPCGPPQGSTSERR